MRVYTSKLTPAFISEATSTQTTTIKDRQRENIQTDEKRDMVQRCKSILVN